MSPSRDGPTVDVLLVKQASFLLLFADLAADLGDKPETDT